MFIRFDSGVKLLCCFFHHLFRFTKFHFFAVSVYKVKVKADMSNQFVAFYICLYAQIVFLWCSNRMFTLSCDQG